MPEVCPGTPKPRAVYQGDGTGFLFLTVTVLALMGIVEYGPSAALLYIGFTLGLMAHIALLAWGHLVGGRRASSGSSGAAVSMLMVGAIAAAGLQSAAGQMPASNAPPTADTVFGWQTTLRVEQPLNPDLAESPIIVGAVCLGVGVGVIGWIVIKAHNACMDIKIRMNTNAIPAQSPATVPTIEEMTFGESSGCLSCNYASATAGQPIPLVIEHSPDGANWTSVTGDGLVIGQEYVLPDSGRWRARVRFLTIERAAGGLGATLRVPPGLLQASDDLVNWRPCGRFYRDAVIPAADGTFYRMGGL